MPYGSQKMDYNIELTPELKKEFNKFKLTCKQRENPRSRVYWCNTRFRGNSIRCAFYNCPHFQNKK